MFFFLFSKSKRHFSTHTHSLFHITLDIPGFNLNAPYSDSPPQSPTQTLSSTGADTSGPSSRRTSTSSVGFSAHSGGAGGEGGISASGSGSGRSAGSGASSRSTSFNLPDEARKGIEAGSSSGERGEEVEEDEEMDPEGKCGCLWLSFIFSDMFFFKINLAAAKHAAFVRARGRHYSNEAEAMKVIAFFVLVSEKLLIRFLSSVHNN